MSSARETAVQVLQSLRTAGFEAYFAGGCVRDELLGLHPKDYDIATSATPDDVRSLFSRTNEVGASFGVMLVRKSRWQVEVTTFRREGGYSDRRRPDAVEYADAPSDAQRRDFTINALFLDPLESPSESERQFNATGHVIDFVGGLDDLQQRVIRAVGIPDDRLAEDHLRALRAVRFAARLGFTIDRQTADAIRRHAQQLEGVSRERIGDEVRLMLAAPTRAAAMQLLDDLGLDAPVLSEAPIGARNSSDLSIVASLPANVSFETALAAWAVERTIRNSNSSAATPDDRCATRWRAALCLSNDERDAFKSILTILKQIRTEWSSLPVAARKRTAARPGFGSACLILDTVDPALAANVRRDFESLESDGVGVAPPPLITGDDLIQSGFQAGPRMGAMLHTIYDRQLEGLIRSKADAIDLARELSAEA